MKRFVICALAIGVGGCATDRPMGHRESGAAIGALGGAAIGAVAYDRNRTKGALVGAVGGALAGGAIGRYMDDQKRDLEKNLSGEIQSGQARVEKLGGDVVRITMTNQTAFETDSADVKPAFHSTMDKIADVVVRYGKTTLTVVGHTDDVGSHDFIEAAHALGFADQAHFTREFKRVHHVTPGAYCRLVKWRHSAV